MVRKLQSRRAARPGLVSQVTGVGRTAVLVALGAAVKTARSTPAVLADLASSGEQFLRSRKPRLPAVGPPEVPALDSLFRRRLEQVLERLAVPTQRDLERLHEELAALQQRVDTLPPRDEAPAPDHDPDPSTEAPEGGHQ